ncbi:hypothetical protein FD723_35080 (plasmid) [Nostoc sp. C052]|nr:hypothetical protein FD723_35080 [Nostoc sp. C052]
MVRLCALFAQACGGSRFFEDGSWLSPEAYQSILRQSKRSLPWDVRRREQIRGSQGCDSLARNQAHYGL